MFDITAFKRPLDSHLHKRYIEQLVYMLLEHIFPEFASTPLTPVKELTE